MKPLIKTLYYPIAITVAVCLLPLYVAAGVVAVVFDIIPMIFEAFAGLTEKVLNQLEMWGDRL